MKKTSSKKAAAADDLRPEYDLDFKKMKPNRFASRLKGTVKAVVLDADVAEVFDSSESVNTFLRSAIRAMPRRTKTKTAAHTKRAS